MRSETEQFTVRLLIGTAITLAHATVIRAADSQSTTNPATKLTMTTTSSAPAHTNRLIHATSPYLLQHAHNPVDWFEWGPDALRKARDEDKPIFLSIGYSACHWCHVMERESFENEEIASVLNEHFVPIKVDREERPDLDDIYMMATQALTQSGGWPMSVWLTPDLKPFYAGTYFPPDDNYGRPGFKRVLLFLADIWKNQRPKALEQADQLTAAVRQLTSVEPGKDLVAWDTLEKTANTLARSFDPVKGGMSGGGTNKFPPSMAMDLMLRVYHKSEGTDTPNHRMLETVEKTLEKMAYGGIYDQLGGGIARYSTDVDWLVPHFEKMLYDQALVSDIYLKAFQLTKKPLYARIASEIFDYVINDLQSPEGGFYSTRDADSEGHEGKFYIWKKSEIVAVLGEKDAELFCDYYDVTDAGNWEGQNILNIQRPLETVAKLHGLSASELDAKLKAARKKLFDVRESRVKPHLDDKILASWNGLMIASMAKGARILGEKRFSVAASRAADFVLSEMTRNDRIQRTYRQGKCHTSGYLDDYAFMIEALLNLYETTFDLNWLDAAEKLNRQVLRYFSDEADGGFFFTPADGEKLLVRSKDINDSAIPSGNSVQLMNLLRLSVLLDQKDLAMEADRTVRAFSKQIESQPFRSERMLCAIDFHTRRPREFAFVATKSSTENLEPFIDAAWQAYVPNAVFARLITDGQDAAAANRIPLLKGKSAVSNKACVYVCRDFACQAPVSEVSAFVKAISH